MSLIENSMNRCKYSILNQSSEGGHTLVLLENINYFSLILRGKDIFMLIYYYFSNYISHWPLENVTDIRIQEQ